MPVKERGWILYNLWRMPQELLVWLPPVPAIGMVSARQFQWWSCVIAFHGYILTGNCVQISKQMQRHCERNENKLWPGETAEEKQISGRDICFFFYWKSYMKGVKRNESWRFGIYENCRWHRRGLLVWLPPVPAIGMTSARQFSEW